MDEIHFDDNIFIWLGNDGNEYLWKSAILNFLRDVNVEVYNIDWGSIEYHSINGLDWKLYSLYVCTSENIRLSHGHFQIISDEDKLFFVNIWSE